MLALQHTCKDPAGAGNKPYITEMHGGRDNSQEGAAAGMTHAFIVGFESLADRDYYVNADPVHAAFKARAGEVVERVLVVDYTVGEF
ncbi:hypothetical protein EJ05DRAFT_478482 [Pseudovirgaria hyperparasitica]|uniref:Stress-response A/B barrel domain-containing protein n=1 Tax=Pseudovirgaria hyperparasitica TaxID=470096 RepID=A0A6A6W0H3_9PEZI|nr:uncharacterized protein EJ05DRAFT_478482 [Pseudovirgaria hyperparasitica]KAF2755484.1 hypothetical protein EJ05DRAFT_478482 [Pseudovirgaria hyperparasitica]